MEVPLLHIQLHEAYSSPAREGKCAPFYGTDRCPIWMNRTGLRHNASDPPFIFVCGFTPSHGLPESYLSNQVFKMRGTLKPEDGSQIPALRTSCLVT